MPERLARPALDTATALGLGIAPRRRTTSSSSGSSTSRLYSMTSRGVRPLSDEQLVARKQTGPRGR